MNYDELTYLQNLPLNIKIAKTELRIREAINYFGIEGLYISVSGGLDSTVLYHIIKNMNDFSASRIKSVYCNTGVDFPDVKEHALTLADEIVKPEMSFAQVVTKYGYPCISKTQAHNFYELTNHNCTEEWRNKILYGDERGTAGMLSKKFHYLLDKADFKISDKCCIKIKEKPLNDYTKKNKCIPFIGMLADESSNRKFRYIKDGGCNAFNISKPQSRPLGFWKKQDVLEYAYVKNIKLAKRYGKVYYCSKDKQFKTTGCTSSGCYPCIFGCHREKPVNRFEKMKKTDPQLYNYCMKGGTYDDKGYWIPNNGLGIAHVLDVLNITY